MVNKWVNKKKRDYFANTSLIIGNTVNITSPPRLVQCKKENGLNRLSLSLYFLYNKKGFPLYECDTK